jgi:adenosylcobinamide amidohydrolase
MCLSLDSEAAISALSQMADAEDVTAVGATIGKCMYVAATACCSSPLCRHTRKPSICGINLRTSFKMSRLYREAPWLIKREDGSL